MLTKVSRQCLVVLLLSLAVFIRSSAASLPQQSGEPDYSSLFGVWEGEFSIIKNGECSIDGSERADYGVQVTLDVASDGSFTAVINQEKVKVTRTWNGRFDKDLKFTATGTGKARCHQGAREYTIKYVGKVQEKKGRFSLEVRGRDEACPGQECVFNQIYQLKQK